jgi:hypothetical protein
MTEDYSDFGDILVPEFETPRGVIDRVEGEARQFYRHPAGTYIGFVGKTVHKFVDTEGKFVEANEPGAIYKNSTVQIWLSKFLGNTENPVGDVIVTSELKLPDRPMQECYYPIALSDDPKWFWKMGNMFKSWKIPGHEKYTIIQPSKTNPSNKVMHKLAFPAYQGLPVKFTLTFKLSEGKSADDVGRYVEGEIEIMDYAKRISVEKLMAFYKEVDARFDKEKAEKAANRARTEGAYEREAAPNTDFDALDSNSNDLDSFMKV